MKKSVFTVVALLGITAATTIIVTMKKARNKKNNEAVGSDSHAAGNRHTPKGRHTMVRKRINDMPGLQLN